MVELQAPAKMTIADEIVMTPTVFLAGAIDMGAAINWQRYVIKQLEDIDCIAFNPRRDDWDSAWVQSKENPKFVEQVMWETAHLENADMIFFCFPKNSKAPITFFELGVALAERSVSDVIVFCDPEFYRRGNIDIMCEHYNVHVYHDMDEAVQRLRDGLEELAYD